MDDFYLSGRGAQINPVNRFVRARYVTDFPEGLDEPDRHKPATQVFEEQARTIVNHVASPDLGMTYSLNPYQGCEHGCIYCYARNTHEYYGFNAGLDFESKIIVKLNAPRLLEKHLYSPSWRVAPISLSGNTDCYQPLERTYRLTRAVLIILAYHRHPVSIITKNSLILRDLDVLQDMAAQRLVHVYISVTTLDEELRSKMEPRTASAAKRLQTIRALAEKNIPTGVMCAPMIPGLNHHEVPAILKAAREAGAVGAGMQVVRLNGSIGSVFEDWLRRNFPERFHKVWNQICALHGGTVNDSQFGRRLRGTGAQADSMEQLFRAARRKYFEGCDFPPYDLTRFQRTGTLSLF